MNDDSEMRALDELSRAISRLEKAVDERAGRGTNQALQIARKHAALKAEIAQAVKDMDALIEGLRHG